MRAQNCLIVLLIGAIINLILGDLFKVGAARLGWNINYLASVGIVSALLGGGVVVVGLIAGRKK